LTAASYRHFLESKLQLHLENISRQTRYWMWLKHNGASPHFGRDGTEYLE